MANFVKADKATIDRVRLVQLIHSVFAVVSLMRMFIFFIKDIAIFGMPTINQNHIFNLDNYLGTKSAAGAKLTFNIALFMIFFVQHIIMARKAFKDKVFAMWKNYVFYERIIFNTVSAIILTINLSLYQPIGLVVFDLNGPLFNLIFLVIYLSGLALFVWSFLDMGENDILCFGLVRMFYKNKGSDFPAAGDFEENSTLRRSSRNPLYFSLMMMIASSNTTITITQLQFKLMWILFTYIGAQYEMKDCMENKGYREYAKKVPEFFPNIRVWFSSKNKNK